MLSKKIQSQNFSNYLSKIITNFTSTIISKFTEKNKKRELSSPREIKIWFGSSTGWEEGDRSARGATGGEQRNWTARSQLFDYGSDFLSQISVLLLWCSSTHDVAAGWEGAMYDQWVAGGSRILTMRSKFVPRDEQFQSLELLSRKGEREGCVGLGYIFFIN